MSELTDFRTQIAAALVAGLPDDVGVFDSIPDSIAPPSVYVTWGSPWMVQTTWCEYTSMAQLILVAQRIEPGGQYGVLESLVSQVLAVLRTNRIALRDVSPPYPLVLAGVNYLSCSVNIITEMGD
jgi:hypothetical protein